MIDKYTLIGNYCKRLLNQAITDFIKQGYNELIKGTNIFKCDFFLDIILNRNLNLYEEYLKKWMGDSSSFLHRRDNRTTEEYAKELIYWWLVEDITIEYIKRLWYQAERSWWDKEREILINPNTDNDIEIKLGEKTLKIEILSDFTWFWNNQKKIHLRDSKYLKIKNNWYWILGIDFKNETFVYIGNDILNNAKYLDYHIPWKKPAYEIDLLGINIKKNNWAEKIIF